MRKLKGVGKGHWLAAKKYRGMMSASTAELSRNIIWNIGSWAFGLIAAVYAVSVVLLLCSDQLMTNAEQLAPWLLGSVFIGIGIAFVSRLTTLFMPSTDAVDKALRGLAPILGVERDSIIAMSKLVATTAASNKLNQLAAEIMELQRQFPNKPMNSLSEAKRQEFKDAFQRLQAVGLVEGSMDSFFPE